VAHRARHHAPAHHRKVHHAQPKPAPATTAADPVAVAASTPVKAVRAAVTAPVKAVAHDDSTTAKLLLLGAGALILVAITSASLLRLLTQLDRPRRGW
jgi:hypothetical protein